MEQIILFLELINVALGVSISLLTLKILSKQKPNAS